MDSAFPDYQKLVMEYYQQKKGLHLLRSALDHPTQAKLKKECLRLCQGKVLSKDEKVIRDFCEKWEEGKTCFQNLVKYDADKFKPLSNYLKKPVGNTDPKYIELLAWLIEFPSRPYDYSKDYTGITVDDLLKPQVEADSNESSTQVGLIIGSKGGQAAVGTKVSREDHIGVMENRSNTVHIDRTGGINEETHNEPATRRKRHYSRAMIVSALLVAIVAGGYWWWGVKPPEGSCMYWEADHYQPIPCNQKVGNARIVPINTLMVKHFKKITKPDTITNRAKGYVWYSKINNKVEFFTADGDHPVVIDRHLKPVTEWIIDKYARPDTTSGNSQSSFLSN